MELPEQSSRNQPQAGVVHTPPRHPDIHIPNYGDRQVAGSRSRVRRPTMRWEGLEEANRLAQIIVLDHGGHARPVINRGQKHLRSRMSSRKTGLQQIVEGRGHRDLAMWNEVNPQVLDWQAHPFHIRVQVADEPYDSYPDHIRLMRDGRIELLEVKRTPEDLRDPRTRRKMGAVAEIVRRGGWDFRILYHADIIGPRWRVPNVEALYARRFLLVTREEQEALSAFLMAGDPTSWSVLRHRIAPGDPRRGNAVIENAVALGRLDIDLDQRITCATVVTPLARMPHRGQIRI